MDASVLWKAQPHEHLTMMWMPATLWSIGFSSRPHEAT